MRTSGGKASAAAPSKKATTPTARSSESPAQSWGAASFAFALGAGTVVQAKCGTCGEGPCRCEDGLVQKKPVDAAGAPTATGLSFSSPGRPLSPERLAYFGARFDRDFSAVRVHDGTEGNAHARSLGALALTQGTDIAFAEGRYQPGSRDGEHLLSHELAHVVQQEDGARAPQAAGLASSHHEREADRAADAVLSGAAVGALTPVTAPRPQLAPDPVLQPPDSAMHGTLDSFYFVPVAGSKMVAGKKGPQYFAVVVKRLVGASYTPGLAEKMWATRTKADNIWTRAEEEATPGKAFPSVLVDPVELNGIIAQIKDVAGVAVTLSAEHQELMNLGIAAQRANDVILVGGLPSWYHGGIRTAMWSSHAALLREMWNAVVADKADTTHLVPSGNAQGGAASFKAFDNLVTVLAPGGWALDSIRTDPTLTNHPVYRKLWPSSAPATASAAGKITDAKSDAATADPFAAPVAAADAFPTEDVAVRVLTYFDTQPALLDAATKSKPEDKVDAANARRELLDRYADIEGSEAGKTLDPTKETQKLSDQPSVYNLSPYPASLTATPTIAFPTYQASIKGEYAFTMLFQFGTANPFAAFQRAAYRFERVAIPKADVIGAAKKPLQLPPGEVAPSAWDRLKGRIAKDKDYDAADVARYWGGVRYRIGPPGSTLDPIAINSAMRFAGTVIKTGFEAVADNGVGRFTFPDEGAYLVRAYAEFAASTNGARIRAPSVAYLPVFASSPDIVAETSVQQMLQGQEDAKKRVAEIDEKIGGELEDPYLSAADRTALKKEREALVASTGGVLELLTFQRKQLVDTQSKAGTQAEKDKLQDAIDALDKIIKNRTARSLGAGAARLFGTFVNDSGQTVYLLLEAQDATSADDAADPAKKKSWLVNDATAPSGRSTTGAGVDKKAAILDAVKQIFDKGDYGRGIASVRIEGAVVSIPVTSVGPAAVFKEAMGNISLILSVLAVAAAPFTGGQSLWLMIPAGVIGAVPSAYRIVDRAIDHNLYFDLETALDVVNIVGAVVGVGAAGMAARSAAALAAAGKAFKLASGALVLVGVVNAGAGIVMMGAQLVKQLESLQDLPVELRAAAMLEIIGNAMLQAGIMIGGALMAKGKVGETQKTIGETTGASADLWWRTLNEETQKELDKPERAAAKATYFAMKPAVRELLTLCASLCVGMDPPPSAVQQALVEQIAGKLSGPEQRLFKGMLHDANAVPGELNKLLNRLKGLNDEKLKAEVNLPANVAGAALVSFSEDIKGGVDPTKWSPATKALRALVESVFKEIGKTIDIDRIGRVLDNVRRTKGGDPRAALEWLRQLGTRMPPGWEAVLADLESQHYNKYKGASWVMRFITESGLWEKVVRFEVPGSEEGPITRRWDARIGGQLFQFKSWSDFYEATFLKQVLQDYLLNDRFSSAVVKWVFDAGLGSAQDIVRFMSDALDRAYDARRTGFDAATVDALKNALPKMVEVGSRAPVATP